jgi:hypothetical protein
MTIEFNFQEESTNAFAVKQPAQTNGFVGHECVLKSCCKKYKKGKRCKKCPD